VLDTLARGGDGVHVYSEIDVNDVLPLLALRHRNAIKRIAARVTPSLTPAASDQRRRVSEAIRRGQLPFGNKERAEYPEVVVWPYRLREPNIVQAAQAVVARALLRGGARILILLDDLGSRHDEELAERFVARMRQWVGDGPDADAIVIQSLRERHVLFPKNLTYDKVRDLLESAADLRLDAALALSTEAGRGTDVNWHEIVSPLLYWSYLSTLPDRGLALDRVWTLGGDHHAPIWEPFDHGLNDRVGHVLVPSPRDPRGRAITDDPVLWRTDVLLRPAVAGRDASEHAPLVRWAWRYLWQLPSVLAGEPIATLPTRAGDLRSETDLDTLIGAPDGLAATTEALATYAQSRFFTCEQTGG
jgi:hypothetical protein